MNEAYERAKLVFLDEIAKQNQAAAELLRQHPEALRGIIEAAVAALIQGLASGTAQTVEAIRSAPRPESIVGPLAALQNAVVMQGNRQQALLKMVAAAVANIKYPDPVHPVRKWKVTPDRNYDTQLIQSVIIEAVD